MAKKTCKKKCGESKKLVESLSSDLKRIADLLSCSPDGYTIRQEITKLLDDKQDQKQRILRLEEKVGYYQRITEAFESKFAFAQDILERFLPERKEVIHIGVGNQDTALDLNFGSDQEDPYFKGLRKRCRNRDCRYLNAPINVSCTKCSARL